MEAHCRGRLGKRSKGDSQPATSRRGVGTFEVIINRFQVVVNWE